MFDGKECPKFLISDKDNPEADFTALTSEKRMKKLLADLCKELSHPVAAFDYNRLIENENGQYAKKIESDVNFLPLRTSCKLLRRCGDKNYCARCDAFHAKSMAIDAETIERNIEESLLRVPDFFYTGYVNRPPKVLRGFDRPILEYFCPMLGYRELIFPIIHREKKRNDASTSDRIVGVLFVGQLSIESEKDEIKDSDTFGEIRKQFFENKKPDELFGEFVDEFNQEHEEGRFLDEDIKNIIMWSDDEPKQYDRILNFRSRHEPSLKAGETEDARAVRYQNTFSSEFDYTAFLQEICKQIKKSEETLEKEYNEKRDKYFKSVMDGIADEYEKAHTAIQNQQFGSIYEKRNTELKEAWKQLYAVADKIKSKKDFSFVEAVSVFGDGETLTIGDADIKKMQYPASENPQGDGSRPTYNFTNVRNLALSEAVNTISSKGKIGDHNKQDSQTLLEGLSKNVLTENCILVTSRSIAILIKVKELKTHELFYKSFADAVSQCLGRINCIVTLCKSQLTKEKHVLTLRMYRHETAHVSERLKNMTDRYFEEDGYDFSQLPEKKQRLVVSDMKNTIQLLSSMADNIGLLTGSLNKDSSQVQSRERFDVINMLYKWRSMFHDQLLDRHLEIIVQRSSESGERGAQLSGQVSVDVALILNDKTPFVEGDRYIDINARLFELLVYNLVDNAAKYAYRGSNIYLIWRKVNGAHELCVTSYGPYLETDDKPYELYARGDSPLVRFIQGEGIGLFAVKRIAEILGLEVSHTSDEIAKYYLPFIDLYKKADFQKNEKYRDYEKITNDKLDDYDHAQDRIVINKYETTALKRVTKARLIKRIDLHTYRTTFKVKLNGV